MRILCNLCFVWLCEVSLYEGFKEIYVFYYDVLCKDWIVDVVFRGFFVVLRLLVRMYFLD